jgi:nucleotide-binding universal stress UspA family protein
MEKLMLKNILVPLDGSLLAEGVLPHAIAMATAFDAQITILSVVEQPLKSFGRSKTDPLDWYLQKTEANTYLEDIKTRLENSHITVKTLLLEGRAIEKIIEIAQPNNVDLLILSSRGTPDVNGWSVSGAVQQIVQHTRTSTLIIPATQPAQSGELIYRRLLVPLDGSRRAGSALPLATALVQAHHAELVLVHVVNKPEMARYMPLTQEDTELINRFVERNQEEGNKYLEQLRSQLPNNAQTRLLVSDNVAVTLQNFSEQEQIDLLILSAHGYSGEAKWPYGSITNRFITDGTVPLLIVQDFPHELSGTVRDEAAVRQMAR